MGNRSSRERGVEDNMTDNTSKANTETKSKFYRKPYPKGFKRKQNNPPTPYGLFVAEQRDKTIGKISFKDLVTSNSIKWKSLSDEERAVYKDKAMQITHQMRATLGRAQRRPKKYGEKRKLTPFWKFAAQHRPAVVRDFEARGVAKPKMRDVNAKLGQMWKELTPEEQSEYKPNTSAISN